MWRSVAPPGTAPKRSRAPPCFANLGRGPGFEQGKTRGKITHGKLGETVENHG